MMQHDSLDILLNDSRISNDEWIALGKALKIDQILKMNGNDKAKKVNEELRHSFGHTIVNFTRNIYEPDYKDPILKEVALFCELDIDTSSMKIEIIEEKIYQKLVSRYKEKNLSAWNTRKNNTTEYFDMLIEMAKYAKSFMGAVKYVAADSGKIAVARLLGGPIYTAMMANQFIFETNWGKVIPAILIISVIRKRLKVCDIFE